MRVGNCNKVFSKPYSFVKTKKNKISVIAENGNFLEASMV